MHLKEYLKAHGPSARSRLAKALGTHVQQITNFAYGYRHPNIQSAIQINRLTGGSVTLEDLRPDIDWSQMRDDLNAAA